MSRTSTDSLYRQTAERFGAQVPELRRLLRGAPACAEEMLLRHELRRVLREIGAVLETIARSEPDALLAFELASLANAAREIVKTPARGPHRDH